MDFEDPADSPMTAFISFPQVLGHEVVATVDEAGPEAGVEPGQRVVLNPWLSCEVRGIDPVCPACAAGDFSLCWRFHDGRSAPGIHTGNSADAPGGFAELLPAHRRMLVPVPDDVPDEVAVLADPFSVALHAVTRNPPPPGGRAVVYGAGALGTCATAILRALHPDVEVATVARWAAQEALAARLGARPSTPSRGRGHRGARRLVRRRAAPPVGGPAHRLARRRRRRLRHRRRARDLRGRPAGAAGARARSCRWGCRRWPAASGRPGTSRRCGWSGPTPSGSRRSTASASTPSPTTSTWSGDGRIDLTGCSPTPSGSTTGATRSDAHRPGHHGRHQVRLRLPPPQQPYPFFFFFFFFFSRRTDSFFFFFFFLHNSPITLFTPLARLLTLSSAAAVDGPYAPEPWRGLPPTVPPRSSPHPCAGQESTGCARLPTS